MSKEQCAKCARTLFTEFVSDVDWKEELRLWSTASLLAAVMSVPLMTPTALRTAFLLLLDISLSPEFPVFAYGRA